MGKIPISEWPPEFFLFLKEYWELPPILRRILARRTVPGKLRV
jgi:hypothetical protein